MGEEKQTWRGNVRGQEMEVGEEDGGRGIKGEDREGGRKGLELFV